MEIGAFYISLAVMTICKPFAGEQSSATCNDESSDSLTRPHTKGLLDKDEWGKMA